jgi:hypothetical protein
VKRVPLILILAVLAGFAYGLFHLFDLRFETGDVYPPYSSLRADPFGAKALYDSLQTLMDTRRNFRPLTRLQDAEGVTLFYLGLDPADPWSSTNELGQLEEFASKGGRVVISFQPKAEPALLSPFWMGRSPAGGGNAPGPRGRGPSRPGNLWARPAFFRDRWGIDLRYEALPKAPNGDILAQPASLKSTSALPAAIAMHTTLYFRPSGQSWQVIYARQNKTNESAVLVERQFGRGAILLAADSFPFSNEAMRNDRQSALLLWVVGAGQTVIFDETHLGVLDSRGVAGLARRYRLHGLFAALLALAGLFIWQRSTSFMPAPEDQIARERAELVAGRDSAAGFTNLLRRNIPPDQILKVCLDQWTAHLAQVRKPSPEKLQEMQTVIDQHNALEARQRNPILTYRRFCQILSKHPDTRQRRPLRG